MKKLLINFAALACLSCLLCACAKKAPVPNLERQPTIAAEIDDIKNFPQNLEVYAREAGYGRRLLPEATQAQLYASFRNIYFDPWEMKRTSISKNGVSSTLKRAGGYQTDGSRWTAEQIAVIRNNANMGTYPSRSAPGITLRQTDLREIPTHAVKFDKPASDLKNYPFDYFQYSLLPPGMPVFIAHTSLDGKWHYIECPIAGGWVDAADIATVDENFIRQWRTGRYAALIQDKVNLPGTGPGKTDSSAGIGTILPVAASSSGNAIRALVPVREVSGTAGTAEILLPKTQAILMPEALTPANVAKIGNQMINQPYGWGGTLGQRDCSAMIRDLYAPFGIWLPRNSAAQSKRGSVLSLAGMSIQEKEAAILNAGTPFLSLVGLPGHITLYVGQWKKRPALFHNAWGLRIVKDGNDDERFIIGKAVVTSITPGMELPDLYRPRTFADRVRSLSTPGK